VFGKVYLRPPMADDTARILENNAAWGFPRMFGSIDCMYWGWKNCPFSWQVVYTPSSGSPLLSKTLLASTHPNY
jgi:hypothetical protein